jgi:peptidoglycan/LPS O-acetylase OafA/YrhL
VPAPLLPLALWQAFGGTSPFPLFPWAGYFFAGAILALLAGGGGGRRAAGMAAAGAALVLSTAWSGVGTAPPGEPALIAFRIGVVLIVLALLSLVPAELARRAAPLGRASLGVYAIHVPIVYGWSTVQGLAGRIGPNLGFAAAAAVAAAVLAASFALFRGLVALRDGLLGLVARARARLA